MLKIYDLLPQNGQKSFYGKAKVYVTGDNEAEVLFSYNTMIIARDLRDGKLYPIWNGWSATTGKHIKAFCGLNKKQYRELYNKNHREKI